MTPLQILSDLHLEFFPKGSSFMQALPVTADILILAGDVHPAGGIRSALYAFSKKWKHIVFVAGNHEFYGSSPPVVEAGVLGEPREFANVYVLENSLVELHGQRFLGCTLWFPPPVQGDKDDLNDYRSIRNLEPWVYERNAASVRWLEANVRPGDVVVTHHLPSPRSVHAKYTGDPLNEFFVTDLTALIEQRQPALWVHGHTHESCDYRIGTTRVICNPYGYEGYATNANFDSGLTVLPADA